MGFWGFGLDEIIDETAEEIVPKRKRIDIEVGGYVVMTADAARLKFDVSNAIGELFAQHTGLVKLSFEIPDEEPKREITPSELDAVWRKAFSSPDITQPTIRLMIKELFPDWKPE